MAAVPQAARPRVPQAAPLAAVALIAACASGPRARPGGPERLSLRAARTLAEQAGGRHGLDPFLLLGVMHVESRFRPGARSGAGARGLMQLMPRTAASLARKLGYGDAYDIHDPAFNVDAGAAYLAYLVNRFGGDLTLALAAYNSGPARVSGWLRAGKPLPGYSRRYARLVLAARDRFRQGEAPAEVEGDLDRAGLTALLRRAIDAHRPDEPVTLP